MSMASQYIVPSHPYPFAYLRYLLWASAPFGHKADIMLYRKKFRKMKLKFDQKMSQSNILYKQEQEAVETARRLAIENESVVLLAGLSYNTDKPIANFWTFSSM